jgi:hypothetical protein
VAAAFLLSSGDGQMNDVMNDGDELWSVPVLCDDVVQNWQLKGFHCCQTQMKWQRFPCEL